MRFPAKLAFSLRYTGREICGAYGLLDQTVCEELGTAEQGGEIGGDMGARWKQ